MKYPKFESLNILAGNSENPGKCVGYEQISVDNSVQSLDLSVCSKTPKYAIMSLELEGSSEATGIIARYRIDGESPSTTKGMPKYDRSVWTIISTEDLVRFRIIGIAEGSHVLNVEYYY
jgi:hypothetical protein